jgi:putative ABC transport system ATP-binding protein
VHDNLEFVLECTGWKSKSEREKRIQEVLDLVDLPKKGYKMPHELSGGEQQRVAVARALGMETKVLLADEPTGNLDSKNSEYLFGVLESLAHEDGYCVVIVTHDDALGKRADEALRIHDGELV